MELKKLSSLMLISNLICTLFYACSYPYVYAETLKAVSHRYISLENIITCTGTIIVGLIWNKYGDRLFKYYNLIVILEIVADVCLFSHVMITGNLKFYFIFNVLIFAFITKNMICGGIKIKALVNPDSDTREKYDNNSNTINSISTLLGTTVALIFDFKLDTLFIFALIGNIIDNFFYIYIYNKLNKIQNI